MTADRYCSSFLYSTCVAPGVITCTRERCTNNDDIPCSIRHVPGDCRNNTNRYFFDPSTSTCLNFSGGCAGENLVEFSTPLACFQHCMIESECYTSLWLQTITTFIVIKSKLSNCFRLKFLEYFLQAFAVHQSILLVMILLVVI